MPLWFQAQDEQVLILLANEPRFYRESLAAALRLQLSADEIMAVDPGQIDDYVTRLEPQAVISSRRTPVLAQRQGWMLLYPRYEDEAVIDVSGHAMPVHAPDLQLVLAFLTMVSAKS